MLIYNTFSRKKEEFEPVNPPAVTMYICGPTVYDYFHIGNARSFIMGDIIRRYLIFRGYRVKFVMNITDIDDKIIKKAAEEKTDTSGIASRFSDAFLHDLEKLKINQADVFPRATEHIEEIIDVIKKIELNGAAYDGLDSIYYDISKFREYGKLSGKKLDELESGARVEVNSAKRDPLDFALWKKAKPGEPSWESPWGPGRPGWHIECSAMSMKHLGESIDIHCGGNDLIFPHHENEIAQSEIATGKKFVKYWLHFGFLNIQEEKMSKSLGNFFTAREILGKYPAEALRLLYLQTHYSGPLSFTEDLLISASKGFERIKNFALLIKENINSSPAYGESRFDFEKYRLKFTEVMDDDFNTPKGLAVFYDFIKDANSFIQNNKPGKEFFREAYELTKAIGETVFGIVHFDEINAKTEAGIESKLIELLIEMRQQAKLDKNYKLADEIRLKLGAIGVTLQDSKEGTTYRITV
ncbi:MAG: cysteine--tRNA ligase [Ignavibacteriales bacterium]|nr:cysteine--tRNA ligase [Ignavibacteriales bacterium]MCF8314551.1 cysteine--tRNA ligase [Ignavibacteriales bacterium]MCF8436412.1 cysteine--tRNA ligase [Ignavibacteriales bacterium]